jgi:tRNA nucleotidyltransferase/poly(A) polymerase
MNTNNWKEIAKAITPNEYQKFINSRNPNDIEFTDIGTDVKRRDLTINAMFYDIYKGEIVDLVGGRDDLQTGKIRTVGNPKDRFSEDPLRKLRALRFYARMGKTIDRETLMALKDNDLSGVSNERIRDEFIKSITSAQNPEHYMQLMHKLGYLNAVVGGISYVAAFPNSNQHEVQLASILQNHTYDDLVKTLGSLRYTNEEVRSIITLIEMYNVYRKGNYDQVYNIWKAYQKTNKNVVKDGAAALGMAEFEMVLSTMDIKDVNTKELAKQHNGTELGQAIKQEFNNIFKQRYGNTT